MILGLRFFWVRLIFLLGVKLFEYRFSLRPGIIDRWCFVRVSHPISFLDCRGVRVKKIKQYVCGAIMLGPASSAPLSDKSVYRRRWGFKGKRSGRGKSLLKAHPVRDCVLFQPILPIAYSQIIGSGLNITTDTFDGHDAWRLRGALRKALALR